MQKRPLSGPYILFAAALLLAMALLSGGAALRESVTVDEIAHLGAGVSYLQRLDFRMNPEHPPLAKVLAALPPGSSRRTRRLYRSCLDLQRNRV